jgi:hypothetical protein
VTPVARNVVRELVTLLRLMARMTIQKPDLRRFFWRTFIDTARHNPPALQQVVTQMVLYLHLGPFAKFVVQELDRQIGAIDVAAARFLHWPEPHPGSRVMGRTPRNPRGPMSTLLIIILILILFGGGGGYYAHRSYGGRGLGGVLGLVLVILLILWLVGALSTGVPVRT